MDKFIEEFINSPERAYYKSKLSEASKLFRSAIKKGATKEEIHNKIANFHIGAVMDSEGIKDLRVQCKILEELCIELEEIYQEEDQ
jgi:hypothetical protein